MWSSYLASSRTLYVIPIVVVVSLHSAFGERARRAHGKAVKAIANRYQVCSRVISPMCALLPKSFTHLKPDSLPKVHFHVLNDCRSLGHIHLETDVSFTT